MTREPGKTQQKSYRVRSGGFTGRRDIMYFNIRIKAARNLERESARTVGIVAPRGITSVSPKTRRDESDREQSIDLAR